MPDDIIDSRPLVGESRRLPTGGGPLSVDCFLKVVGLAVAYFHTGWLYSGMMILPKIAQGLAVAYFHTGWLGLLLAIPPGYATAVWLPSGIALVGLLWWGPRVWLGSFLVNVWVSLTAANAEISFTGLAVAASIGSTLQALLGAFLLQRWVGAGRLFERGTAILAFAAIEALCCLLAPTWGVTSLCLAGVLDWAAYFDSALTWWLGDLIGGCSS